MTLFPEVLPAPVRLGFNFQSVILGIPGYIDEINVKIESVVRPGRWL